MATLHIEHPISDLPTWLGAFSRFRDARQSAGVRAERVLQPVDDDKYVYVSLDFDSVEQAAAFQKFLETNVGTSPEASPALAGTPRARVLTDVEPAS
jgi:arginase family enzyme